MSKRLGATNEKDLMLSKAPSDPGVMPSVLLARRLHDTIAQRLSGLSYFLGDDGPAPEGALDRCRDEIHAAIGELREALASVGRPQPIGLEELDAEARALCTAFPGVRLDWQRGAISDAIDDPLVDSFLVEALRNVRKHSLPTEVVVTAIHADGAVVVSVTNDGVLSRPGRGTNQGARLLALEASAHGALADSRSDRPGHWQQRLIVPSRPVALVA